MLNFDQFLNQHQELLNVTIDILKEGEYTCEDPFCPLALAAPIMKLIKDQPEVVKVLANLVLFIGVTFEFLERKRITVLIKKNPGQAFLKQQQKDAYLFKLFK